MTVAHSIRGLYAITDTRTLDDAALLRRTEAILRGGARVLQYRDKSGDAAARRRQAEALAALCRRWGACFIVNDDVALAAATGADGVHVGRDDAGVAEARRRLGRGAIVGASCYDDPERGERALAAGADYLAFGSAFPSATKPEAARGGLAALRAARERFAVPLVAIGGITPENAGEAVAAGADAVAVISAIYDATDPEAAAAALAAVFRG